MLRGSKSFANKCLPVNEPMISTYTQHAHLLSILTNYEQTYPWIYSNYIQLYINRDYKHNWGDFYFPYPYELRPSDACKWISSQKVRRNIIGPKWKSIIDFVVGCINENNYFHTMLNYFYIPVSERYHRLNLNHDIFVYGYDLEQEILYVSDFFKYGRYSFEQISFKDFCQAFIAYNTANNQDYLKGVMYLYNYNNQCDYQFNIINIIKSIKFYLSSAIPEYWDMFNAGDKENIVFGMDIYDTLKNYATEKMSENKYEIDLRPFYMIYDHKKLMTARLNYLYEEGYVKNSNIIGFKELENKARNVVNIIFKYNYTKNRVSISSVINILNDMKNKEYDILNQYTLG